GGPPDPPCFSPKKRLSKQTAALQLPQNIAHLAESALRFLELVQENHVNNCEQDVNEDSEALQQRHNYDSELQALHEMVQQKVVTLLSDPENMVKHSLMDTGITRLCVFFGRQKANDVLLSHMITFLNDKTDWHLRGAFFDSIVGVAAYVGWQSSSILKPLLQQGLSDTEEFVIYKALEALTCMCDLGLLQKAHINEFVSDIAPFLCHPNLWIRYGAVGFITVVAKHLNVADVYCKLMPHLSAFLTQPIIQVLELFRYKNSPLYRYWNSRKHTKQDSTMNEEWKSMFGSQEPTSSATPSEPQKRSSVPPSVPVVQSWSGSGFQRRVHSCRSDLQTLVQLKREQSSAERMTKHLLESAEWESRPPPPGWHPKGLLVAHLHEHKAAVNRIKVSDEHSIFATASNDGTVKVWDSQKMEGKTPPPGTSSGTMACWDMRFQLPISNHSHPARARVRRLLMHPLYQSSVIAGTSLCTCLHLSYTCLHLSGPVTHLSHTCLDQFTRALERSTSPLSSQVRRSTPVTHLSYTCLLLSYTCLSLYLSLSYLCLWSTAVQGNNEVSMWDMETGDRKFTLWASSAPPLSELQTSPHSVHGVYCSPADGNPLLLTAGSDMRIRFWDLAYPERSYIVAGGANDSLHCPSVLYSRKIIEGTEVVQEIHSKQKSGSSEDGPRRGPEALPVGHHDIITDIATFQTTQGFIVTSSRDGIVKVWK
ncbi:hypothetical protein WMY93_032961, partial [Mugilogobius chulae]